MNCINCKDTGWIYNQDSNSAMQCECVALKKASDEFKASGLSIEDYEKAFKNFETWNSKSEEMKQVSIGYFKAFDGIRKKRNNSIMLCGTPGSGKTHLSVALANNMMKKGIKVIYMPYRDTITAIKQNMLDAEFYKKQIGKYQTADVLLIDDLFKGKINETDINIMFEIINYRYLNHLPIIVSSEFTVDRMLNFDEGTASRIYEMCKEFIVQVEGQAYNYRLK